MEEGSGVFFLSLLTSLSLCPHSLLWRKFLECSSSHSPCYPCALTHRYPSVLSHTTCATTHLTLSVLTRTHTHTHSPKSSHRHPCVHSSAHTHSPKSSHRHSCAHTPMTWATTHTLTLTHMSSLCTHTHDLSSHTLSHQVISLIPASTLTHDLSYHSHTLSHSHVIPVFTRVLSLTHPSHLTHPRDYLHP